MKKIKRTISSAIMWINLMYINTLVIPTAHADGLEDSTLVTGTEKLLNDLTKIFRIYIPIIIGLVILGFFFMKSKADDSEAKMWNKRIIGAFICIAVIMSLPSLITAFTSYYE